jgi:hypothetical protein
MNATTITERQLLEQAAQAVGFEYMFYAPQSYHLRSGLLCSSPNGRTRAWNPMVDDADLLQLAVAAPTVNLQDIIVEASRIEGDDAARRAYVREHFVRAVTQAGLPMAETVTVANNDNAAVPTP